jgi:DNA (cytosine-5)-methyltransferase 1
MQIRWQVENDPYCIRILEKHWPSVKRYGDIQDVKWTEVEPVDLICGGFPCQPVSLAGGRKGDKDERWLWPEFLRAIREVRPRYALVENVPGLLCIHEGRLARRVFGNLAEIGYDAEWDSFPASAIGAHFRGERVFIIASRSPTDCLRRKGDWQNPVGKSFSRAQFEGLVQHEIQVCVPAGKHKRVSDGISNRMDRLKAIGNAVLPQVSEQIAMCIIEAEEKMINSQNGGKCENNPGENA